MTTKTKPKAARFLPLVLGIPLGLLSTVKYPPFPPSAIQSGIMVLGGAIGYLLAALIVAYLNAGSWKRSFLSSSLTIVVATAAYYLRLALARLNGNTMVEHYSAMAMDAVKWAALGLVVGALSATFMRLAIYSKGRSLRLGALIAPYLFFVAIAGVNALRIANWYANPGYLTATWTGYNFYSDLYEAAWTFALPTVLFVLGMIRAKKAKE